MTKFWTKFKGWFLGSTTITTKTTTTTVFHLSLTKFWPDFKGRPLGSTTSTTIAAATTTTAKTTLPHQLLTQYWPHFKGRFLGSTTTMIQQLLTPFWPNLNPHYTYTWGGEAFGTSVKTPIMAIFIHSKHQKWYQWTLGTQEQTNRGSKPSLGPSMDSTGPNNWI